MSGKEKGASGNLISVVGGGVIGLSVALELCERGHAVELLEASPLGSEREGKASLAAAGMLAGSEPDRPAELGSLAHESLRRYGKFFEQIEAYSSRALRFQTEETVEHGAHGTRVIVEHSLDPRELHEALWVAVRNAGVCVERGVEVEAAMDAEDGVVLRLADGRRLRRGKVVMAHGAWLRELGAVRPRKGQMLRVQIPKGLRLRQVHRAADVYVVPRLHGAQQGSALIGATVEDVGFDTVVYGAALTDLRRRAARLVPELGDEAAAPMVEAWAGLRPGTQDGLPLIGFVPGSGEQVVAGGHFRDGILLAPVTASAVADLIEGREPCVDLKAFEPGRFAHAGR